LNFSEQSILLRNTTTIGDRRLENVVSEKTCETIIVGNTNNVNLFYRVITSKDLLLLYLILDVSWYLILDLLNF